MYVCIYTYMLYLYHTGVTFLVFRDGFFGNVFPTTLSMKQDFKYCQRQKSELKSNYTHWKTARFLKICISLQNAFTTPCVFLALFQVCQGQQVSIHHFHSPQDLFFTYIGLGTINKCTFCVTFIGKHFNFSCKPKLRNYSKQKEKATLLHVLLLG